MIHDLSAQKEAENKLWYVNRNLENLVDSRTGQLQESINQLSSSNRFLEHEIDFRITVEQKLKVREQELLDALEKERDLSLLKSRFVSIASHEFRTPLANILSSINLVDRYESAEFVDKRKVHISKIKNNIHYLNGILNEFLTLTRIEEGKFELKIESFEIHGMLHEIIEDFNLIKKTGQTLKLNTNNLEGALIETDKTCLKHIMNNLISNAIKYSGEHATIEIELSKLNNFYNILVKDNGIGIPNTEQKFIFDIFYRGSNVLNIQGTGLGLNIVKKYLDTIKGNIRFESMETEGTQITIQLPEIFNYEKNSDH
ncbi:MAG: HAMP domain-containing histidine kinase [Saprospiraceae bacterium]|nr:HAMP domain-containing histidine kinase [Saprospiraceae bacterium]